MDIETKICYWTNFTRHLESTGVDLPFQRPHRTTANELMINFRDGVQIRAWFHTRDRLIGVCLYLTGSEKHESYETVQGMKSEIEARYGEGLEWYPPGDRASGRVALTKLNTNPAHDTDWSNQHRWLAHKSQRFCEMFRPIVKKL